MIDVIKVSSRGQIVLPRDLRNKLQITSGSRLVVSENNGRIILSKESDVERRLSMSENNESLSWLALSEKSLKDVWDNEADQVWNNL